MRACREGTALPEPPVLIPATRVAKAADYAGTYSGSGDRVLKVVAQDERLFLQHRERQVPLEVTAHPKDSFIVLHPDYAHYPLLFSRAGTDGKGAIMEAGWGEDWYCGIRLPGSAFLQGAGRMASLSRPLPNRRSVDRQRSHCVTARQALDERSLPR